MTYNASSCIGVLKKEREILEYLDNPKNPRPKSCLIQPWSISKRLAARRYFQLADVFVDLGIPLEIFYEFIPKSIEHSENHESPSILSLKPESQIRKKMVDYLFNCCINKKKARTRDFNKFIYPPFKDWGEKEIEEHYLPSKINWVISNRKRHSKLQNFTIKKSFLGQSGQTIKCDSVHHNILLRMIDAGYGDTEYAAFCIALKWAAERINQEKGVVDSPEGSEV